MDKLEFDDRIRRLERRSSIHSALLSAGVLILAVVALFALRSAPREASMPATAYVVSTPNAPPPVGVAVDGLGGDMSNFGADLTKAHGLMRRGLITLDDFAAKKAVILERPLHVLDFAGDVEAAKTLTDAGVLTGDEYDTLKKKILESGHS